MIDYRFRAEEFVDRAILDEVEFEYLYNEGDDFHFMNTETYEQMHLSRELLGDTVYYLIPNTVVKVEFFEEKTNRCRPPGHHGAQSCEHRAYPAKRPPPAQSASRPRWKTGLVVQVPPLRERRRQN